MSPSAKTTQNMSGIGLRFEGVSKYCMYSNQAPEMYADCQDQYVTGIVHMEWGGDEDGVREVDCHRWRRG